MERLRTHAVEKLSSSQLNIFDKIQFSSGLAVAEAAAGAGKTRTLSYLILKALMADDVKDVFVLTATRTAKDEALARVTKLHCDLGFDHNGQCPFLPARNVRTIHSICLGSARDEAAEENSAGVSVVSATQIKDMLCEILNDLKSGASSDDEDESEDSSPDVVCLSETKVEEAAVLLKNVRAERLHSCVGVVDDSFGPVARQAMEELERRLRCDPESGMNLMDFDAMTEAYRASGKSIVYPGDVLFVDEGQDLTQCQLSILMNTLRAGGCVVILGDDSQGIFQFSGACDQTLRSLKERARSANIPVLRFALMQNHRSTDSIVAASESLLPFHDRVNRLEVKGNGTVGDPVEVAVFKTEDAEAEGVATRIVDIVAAGEFASDRIVVLRHRNWSWNDSLVQTVRRLASERGVEIGMAIAGQDATNSLEGKFLAVFQVATDLDRFCDAAEDGIGLVKTFLKAMRGKGWNQKIGFRAVETVYQRHVSQDPAAIFTRYREELLSEFRLEEAKDDAEQAEREAKKGSGTVKRKRAAVSSGPSIKERNFEAAIRVAGRVISGVRERVRGIELGRKTLDPIVVSSSTEFFTRDRSKPPESSYPTLHTPLGGLAWLILRDVVAHEYKDTDGFNIQNIVSFFDLQFDNEKYDDVIEAVSEPVSKLSAKVYDKSTAGKLVFSTIHKFKGRESDVAFVCQLTPPWANPDWPRRATLAHEHAPNCKNRSGVKTACCEPFRIGMQRIINAQISEKLRLYYVGASRAKQRLFLSGTPSKHGGEIFAPLLELASNATQGWSKVVR